MDTSAIVIGALAGVIIGVLLGVLLGRWVAGRATWLFWLVASVLTVAGIAVSYVGLQAEADIAFVGGVAFIAGSLTALKYAAGRIPGMGGTV